MLPPSENITETCHKNEQRSMCMLLLQHTTNASHHQLCLSAQRKRNAQPTDTGKASQTVVPYKMAPPCLAQQAHTRVTLGKAGQTEVPYKMPPPYAAQQRYTSIIYRPGKQIRYKPPPPGCGPQRRTQAPAPTGLPREARTTEPPPPTAAYIAPPPQSPPRAKSSQHDVHPTPAEPIRHTTRPGKAIGSNENATSAAAARDDDNVTSQGHPDREDGQTARASRPSETTEASLDAPAGSDASVCSYASLGPDAPFPPEAPHHKDALTPHDTQC